MFYHDSLTIRDGGTLPHHRQRIICIFKFLLGFTPCIGHHTCNALFSSCCYQYRSYFFTQWIWLFWRLHVIFLLLIVQPPPYYVQPDRTKQIAKQKDMEKDAKKMGTGIMEGAIVTSG